MPYNRVRNGEPEQTVCADYTSMVAKVSKLEADAIRELERAMRALDRNEAVIGETRYRLEWVSPANMDALGLLPMDSTGIRAKDGIYSGHVHPLYNIHCELAYHDNTQRDWSVYWRQLSENLPASLPFALAAFESGKLAGYVRFFPADIGTLRYAAADEQERDGHSLLIGAACVDAQANADNLQPLLLARVISYAKAERYRSVRAVGWSDIYPFAMWGESFSQAHYAKTGFVKGAEIQGPEDALQDMLAGAHGKLVKNALGTYAQAQLERGARLYEMTLMLSEVVAEAYVGAPGLNEDLFQMMNGLNREQELEWGRVSGLPIDDRAKEFARIGKERGYKQIPDGEGLLWLNDANQIEAMFRFVPEPRKIPPFIDIYRRIEELDVPLTFLIHNQVGRRDTFSAYRLSRHSYAEHSWELGPKGPQDDRALDKSIRRDIFEMFRLPEESPTPAISEREANHWAWAFMTSWKATTAKLAREAEKYQCEQTIDGDFALWTDKGGQLQAMFSRIADPTNPKTFRLLYEEMAKRDCPLTYCFVRQKHEGARWDAHRLSPQFGYLSHNWAFWENRAHRRAALAQGRHGGRAAGGRRSERPLRPILRGRSVHAAIGDRHWSRAASRVSLPSHGRGTPRNRRVTTARDNA